MLIQNLRYGMRFMRHNPGFTAVIVLTLALGIGANTAIFSVVYSALLRPLPYRNPAELLFLGESRDRDPQIDSVATSYPDFRDWQRTSKSFQSIAAYGGDGFILDAGGEPKLVIATSVTSNFFATLGVKPALGRDFVDGEDQPDGPHLVILSDAFWRSEFGARPDIVGVTIRFDGKPVTIVGVLPRTFEFAPRSAPLYVPLHPQGFLTRRSLRWLGVVGRLASGVTPDRAKAEMVGITAQLAHAYPKENDAISIAISPFRDRIVGKIRPLLLVLLGAVGFVLLIACANVANLLLTRSIARRKEFAVRSAMGATRTDLVAQLLTESLLLSVIGAAIGLIAAQWGVSLLLSAIPESQLLAMPYLRSAGVTFPVLAFLCFITLATAVLFGLIPAVTAARSSVNDILKDETRGGTSASYARLRGSLVVVEIAVTLILLVAGSLMLQSLNALLRPNHGFDPHNVLTFDVNLPDSSYPNDKDRPDNNSSADQFGREMRERLRNTPGVLDVATSTVVPANGNGSTIRFLIEGRPKQLGHEDECNIAEVSRNYFSTLKMPLLEGRYFSEDDAKPGAEEIAIVSHAFASAYFPGETALGKRVRYTYKPNLPYRRIVGVVADAALVDLDQPPAAVIFELNERSGDTFLSYIVRTSGDPLATVGAAREILHNLDPQLPLIQPRTLDQVAQQVPSVFLRSYPSLLIGSFAGLALILAVIGLYGVISYSVLQRTREIGIRVAMGAQRPDVLRLVLREALTTSALGVLVGVISGLFLTRLMSSLLYGVTPGDWRTFLAVSVLLLGVAVAACAIPAARATRVDPVIALRYE
ncbi:MAG TPA: ABC transporter permease [Candidatus Acidoferrum sp.]|nr:ABC transporter permease [Candidatus Acidoferrum sp.]